MGNLSLPRNDSRRLLVLRQLLKPNSNGVDVGCHIGSLLTALKTIAPNGYHVAIEPSKTKGAWLANKFPTTEIHNVAVSDKPGCAMFEENIFQPGYKRKSLRDGKKTENFYYDVEVRRLDDLLTLRVDLLKLLTSRKAKS